MHPKITNDVSLHNVLAFQRDNSDGHPEASLLEKPSSYLALVESSTSTDTLPATATMTNNTGGLTLLDLIVRWPLRGNTFGYVLSLVRRKLVYKQHPRSLGRYHYKLPYFLPLVLTVQIIMVVGPIFCSLRT